MAWFFQIFFGLIGVCVVLALASFLKNCVSRERKEPAVVKERKQNLFPMSLGTARRDRTEYELVFFLPKSNKTVSFTVSNRIYGSYPVGTGGILTSRGTLFIRFETDQGTVDRSP